MPSSSIWMTWKVLSSTECNQERRRSYGVLVSVDAGRVFNSGRDTLGWRPADSLHTTALESFSFNGDSLLLGSFSERQIPWLFPSIVEDTATFSVRYQPHSGAAYIATQSVKLTMQDGLVYGRWDEQENRGHFRQSISLISHN